MNRVFLAGLAGGLVVHLLSDVDGWTLAGAAMAAPITPRRPGAPTPEARRGARAQP